MYQFHQYSHDNYYLGRKDIFLVVGLIFFFMVKLGSRRHNTKEKLFLTWLLLQNDPRLLNNEQQTVFCDFPTLGPLHYVQQQSSYMSFYHFPLSPFHSDWFIYCIVVIFLPLRQKLLKPFQNEAIFPLITMNVLIYASLTFSQKFCLFCLLLFQLFLAEHKVSGTEEKCYFGVDVGKNVTDQ